MRKEVLERSLYVGGNEEAPVALYKVWRLFICS